MKPTNSIVPIYSIWSKSFFIIRFIQNQKSFLAKLNHFVRARFYLVTNDYIYIITHGIHDTGIFTYI